MPEIIEISGLDDEVAQVATDASPIITFGILTGAIFLLAMIPRAIHALRGEEYPYDAWGLGIIRPCRRKDKVPWKSEDAQEWCLWDSKGKKILGRHKTRSRALRQERAIQVRKHR